MPYTLVKFLGWGIAFFAIGLAIGWMLRALRARGDIAALRRELNGSGQDETSVPTSETTASEPPDEPTAAPEPPPVETSDPELVSEPASEPASEPSAVAADERVAEPIPEPATEPALDLDEGAAVLGRTLNESDLTVVDGIGPKIAELCLGIGVTNWQALAHTEVVALQSMLDAAGSRYRVHDPSSWPKQAALLAAGDWQGFKRLTERTDSEP